MADPINPKPWNTISFTLAAGEQREYEVASSACLFFKEGPGVPIGAITAMFDNNGDAFQLAVFDFIRVERFDKLKLKNESAGTLSGVILVSTYPDFLYMNFPRV